MRTSWVTPEDRHRHGRERIAAAGRLARPIVANAPSVLRPAHWTVPSLMSAHTWLDPALIAATFVNPPTTGIADDVLDPFPDVISGHASQLRDAQPRASRYREAGHGEQRLRSRGRPSGDRADRATPRLGAGGPSVVRGRSERRARTITATRQPPAAARWPRARLRGADGGAQRSADRNRGRCAHHPPGAKLGRGARRARPRANPLRAEGLGRDLVDRRRGREGEQRGARVLDGCSPQATRRIHPSGLPQLPSPKSFCCPRGYTCCDERNNWPLALAV